MKKIYLSFFTLLAALGMDAQLQNMNLENWTAGTGYDDPDGWTTVNQYAGFVGASPNVVKLSSNVSEGSFAAEMFTQPCSGCASFGLPDTIPGLLTQETGYYSNTVTDVQLDYQFAPVNGDWGAISVDLTVWDATGDSAIVIASAADTIGAAMSSWTTRTIPFVFNSTSLMPDSIKIYIVSSARDLANDPTFPDPQDGTTLRVDNIKILDPASASVEESEESAFDIFAYNNIITIKTENVSSFNYEVVDLTGKMVLNGQSASAITRINAEQLRSGVYLVAIGNTVKKVVIE
ncbi:T9SS type A sorting domain-containing protein [Parvicella tangerina]|uniref:Secretion system C-terminal sorting domain-containing protein n=1 Tax=Parvicella tangerina TaxID=2829795 RepID=A0A916JKM7_9FLAO|nr:T9SS type A sorting domain-containing protein [Parvicella tangerina]CAG5079645.1 hypothetical protein CRYO30217_00998 [Parvicella tangerina]